MCGLYSVTSNREGYCQVVGLMDVFEDGSNGAERRGAAGSWC
jgi:hypothetical protein